MWLSIVTLPMRETENGHDSLAAWLPGDPPSISEQLGQSVFSAYLLTYSAYHVWLFFSEYRKAPLEDRQAVYPALHLVDMGRSASASIDDM